MSRQQFGQAFVTTIDEHYSRACIRTGATALVLSIIAILTFARSFESDRYLAAVEMAFLKEQLVVAVEAMLDDDCWPELNRERSKVPVLSVFLALCINDEYYGDLTWEERHVAMNERKFPGVTVESSQPNNPLGGKDESEDVSSDTALAATSAEQEIMRPMPPFLYFTSINSGAESVFRALEGLRSHERVSAARDYKNWLAFDIYNWELSKYKLSANAANQWRASRELDSDIPTDLLLSADELDELSHLFPISLADIEQDSGKWVVGLPNIPFSTNLRQTGYMLCAVLLVLSIYFWANVRLAVRSKRFPVEGTVFHTFTSTALSTLLFFLLILTPGVASLLVVENPLNGSWAAFLIAASTISVLLLSIRSIYWVVRK